MFKLHKKENNDAKLIEDVRIAFETLRDFYKNELENISNRSNYNAFWKGENNE